MRTFVLQLTWVVATCVLTFATQAVLFKTPTTSWLDVATHHQWIGVPYLVIAGLVLERLHRKGFWRQRWI